MKKTLDRLDRELASIHKYITPQRKTIDKNKSSKGWKLGYVSAYGARKAIRKLRKR